MLNQQECKKIAKMAINKAMNDNPSASYGKLLVESSKYIVSHLETLDSLKNDLGWTIMEKLTRSIFDVDEELETIMDSMFDSTILA